MLTAEAYAGGFRLHGMSPWVTGGAAADVIVIAATLVEHGEATDRQLLVAVPTDLPGITVADPLPLIGVTASSTGPVHLDGVEVSEEWLIAGPVANVMASGLGGSTGGYETSTLAIGLAQAAINFLAEEAAKRDDLMEPMLALRAEHAQLRDDLLTSVAAGGSPVERQASRSSLRESCPRYRRNQFVSVRTAWCCVRPKQRCRRPRVGLCRRASGGAMVPRGVVLLGVELSTTGGGGELVRVGGHRVLIILSAQNC